MMLSKSAIFNRYPNYEENKHHVYIFKNQSFIHRPKGVFWELF